MATSKLKKNCTAAVVIVIAVLVPLSKGVLLLSTYVMNEKVKNCSDPSGEHQAKEEGYVFVMTILGIKSLIRCFEYFVLVAYTFGFLVQRIRSGQTADGSGSAEPTERKDKILCGLKKKFWLIILVKTILAFSIPTVGVWQQHEFSKKNFSNCSFNYPQIYYGYSVLNYLQYFFEIVVCMKFMKVFCKTHSLWEEGYNELSIIDESTTSSASDKIVKSWNLASQKFKNWYTSYEKVGKEVMELNNLFKYWFIIPWLAYVLISSLKTATALQPWTLPSEDPSAFSVIYYGLYNFNQIFTLLVILYFAKRSNYQHNQYVRQLRSIQLSSAINNTELSFAQQLPVEKRDYDFIPRIWKTNISVEIDNSLYTFSALSGIFFSIARSLFFIKNCN